ncbi:hypothetical protein [Solitalea lacus]|uniref:hypothetical protein n=1 Tax=Solitalea lacus TaxID=2911172 RepID=UPI001EDC75E3|nr:hypothetical protein [Solitalea lacus]UKJ08803.1 hypothetical protein L2B55_06455 [Solitalea lacus]
MRSLGLTLLTLGVAILAFSSFSMIFREKAIKIGKVEMADPNYKEVSWIPIIGGVIFIAGTVITLVYRNQEKV